MICATPGCNAILPTNFLHPRTYCMECSTNLKLCSIKTCTNIARSNGYCARCNYDRLVEQMQISIPDEHFVALYDWVLFQAKIDAHSDNPAYSFWTRANWYGFLMETQVRVN